MDSRTRPLNPPLATWLSAHGVAHVCAVSPHLDDAAFSLAQTLHQCPSRHVVTVFSHARADSPDDYTKAMGFADPLQEFEARRDEDARAMALMDTSYTHVGAFTDRFDAAATAKVVAAVASDAAQRDVPLSDVMVLLPAGAGGRLTPWQRWRKRFLREPWGCQPHAEHEWVRDQVRDALQALRCAPPKFGYYGEVPYLWADDSARRLAKLRAQPSGQTLSIFRVKTDADWKLPIVQAYASQVVSEFGQSARYQRRTVATDEWLFLPDSLG